MLNDKFEEEIDLSGSASQQKRANETAITHRAPVSVVEWGLYPSFWNVVPIFIESLLTCPRAAKHISGCILLQDTKPVRRVELCGIITEVPLTCFYLGSHSLHATFGTLFEGFIPHAPHTLPPSHSGTASPRMRWGSWTMEPV